jgi:hypothetical protein
MSSQKTSNNDSCRDLSGRRLNTIKEAKKYVLLFSTPRVRAAYILTRLVEYLESEPERLKAKADAQKAKLEALERKLGIEPPSKTDAPVAGPSKTTPTGEDPPVLAGRKHRFDDTEYLEQSRDLVDGVKSAVSAGMMSYLRLPKNSFLPSVPALLKKKKKAKLSHPASSTEKSDSHPETSTATSAPSVAIGA